MKILLIMLLCAVSTSPAQSTPPRTRREAEYYLEAYAKHYRVPAALVRSIVERESNWQPCIVSRKGAVGLMQLMPATAQSLGVTDRCSLAQNVSGGVRYLAWLMQRIHNDFRLVVAAYYVGENRIGRRGLRYKNPDVVAYVESVRKAYLLEIRTEPKSKNATEKRDVR
jgi:soluble lytic murein transglycosylase-like protein